ncbi:MAG: hypothetical protein E6R08_00390 [Nevskiaceae bacterium]|nr:MAG: hypothetical protein E6R08_00390 [Nevskiaceae bacterium]
MLLALAIASASFPALATCEGGICPALPSPVPGLRSSLPDPAHLTPLPVVRRDAHPFVNAGPLPDTASLPPLVQASFEITDLQIEQLTGFNVKRHRASEFHNAVDSSGNTFSAAHPVHHRSPSTMAAGLVLAVLGGSMLLPFLGGLRRSPSPPGLAGLSVPHRISAGAANDLPPIEWPTAEDPPVSVEGNGDQDPWATLVSAFGGDVMLAASAIQAELASDAALAAGSRQAVERALSTARRHSFQLAA